jgi:hypothetical protein
MKSRKPTTKPNCKKLRTAYLEKYAKSTLSKEYNTEEKRIQIRKFYNHILTTIQSMSKNELNTI